jgi:hypothetical protein
MIIQAAHLEFKSFEPRSMAEVIFNYFLLQYKNAIRNECSEEAKLASMISGNKAYDERMKEEFGGGFSQPPYSDNLIQIQKHALDDSKKAVIEAEAIIKFLRNRFFEGLLT